MSLRSKIEQLAAKIESDSSLQSPAAWVVLPPKKPLIDSDGSVIHEGENLSEPHLIMPGVVVWPDSWPRPSVDEIDEWYLSLPLNTGR